MVGAAVRALKTALPFTGNPYRWKKSVRQVLQIGVQAAPMVGLMAMCANTEPLGNCAQR
jgi:hypothetical protein